MNRRLIRALQRGGVAARTQTDVWSIWRSSDRRGRIIGSLSGADVEVLRLRNDLKPLGDEVNQVLTWAGQQVELNERERYAPHIALAAPSHARSLLEMLIANCASSSLRERIRKACQCLMADLEAFEGAGNPVTMNWQSLAQGRLAKGQSLRSEFRTSKSASAQHRLTTVHAALGDDDLRFLLKLVVREASRSAIAKAFGLRPALAEQRGFSVLRALVDAYGT